MKEHNPIWYMLTPRPIRRRRIRDGLRHMGVERVKAAICTVGDDEALYGTCFLSHANERRNVKC